MQEIKQSFPGNRISGFLSEKLKWLLLAIVLVSVLEWETPPNTSLAVHFGIEGTYVPFLAVLVVALLSKYAIGGKEFYLFAGAGGMRRVCPTFRLFLLGKLSRLA